MLEKFDDHFTQGYDYLIKHLRQFSGFCHRLLHPKAEPPGAKHCCQILAQQLAAIPAQAQGRLSIKQFFNHENIRMCHLYWLPTTGSRHRTCLGVIHISTLLTEYPCPLEWVRDLCLVHRDDIVNTEEARIQDKNYSMIFHSLDLIIPILDQLLEEQYQNQ